MKWITLLPLFFFFWVGLLPAAINTSSLGGEVGSNTTLSNVGYNCNITYGGLNSYSGPYQDSPCAMYDKMRKRKNQPIINMESNNGSTGNSGQESPL